MACGFALISAFSGFNCSECIAANTDDKNKSTQRAAEFVASTKRTFVFPKQVVGHLVLVPSNVNEGGFRSDEIGLAVGKMVLAIPTNKYILLDCNGRIVDHPEILDTLSESGLDGIKFPFASMEEEISRANGLIDHLSRFKNLKVLDFDRSDVSDAGLSKIKNTNLELISVFLTETNGSAFKNFLNFSKLAKLDVGHCPLRESNLHYLAKLPKLSHLSIRESDLTPGGLQIICQCSNLVYLDIVNDKKINDNCLQSLLKLRKLEDIDVRGTAITLQGLKQLKGLPLRRISIKLNTYKTQDLAELHACFPHLRMNLSKDQVDKDDQVIFAPIP